MNAPEKIYYNPSFQDYWKEEKESVEDVEYIRKDIVDDMLKKVEEGDCWLFTIQNSNLQIFNLFFSYFPTKKNIQKACNTKVYAIMNVTRLTLTQCNKLLGEEE